MTTCMTKGTLFILGWTVVCFDPMSLLSTAETNELGIVVLKTATFPSLILQLMLTLGLMLGTLHSTDGGAHLMRQTGGVKNSTILSNMFLRLQNV